MKTIHWMAEQRGKKNPNIRVLINKPRSLTTSIFSIIHGSVNSLIFKVGWVWVFLYLITCLYFLDCLTTIIQFIMKKKMLLNLPIFTQLTIKEYKNSSDIKIQILTKCIYAMGLFAVEWTLHLHELSLLDKTTNTFTYFYLCLETAFPSLPLSLSLSLSLSLISSSSAQAKLLEAFYYIIKMRTVKS